MSRSRGSDGRTGRPELGPDFLSRVREVCRLRMDQDASTRRAEIVERVVDPDGEAFDHLIARYTRGPFAKELLVGVHDGHVGAETLRRFERIVGVHTVLDHEPELVYRGPPAEPVLVERARRAGIWLRSFAEYQQVWEHERYVQSQTAMLTGDTAEYPLRLHVDKLWSELGDAEPRASTAGTQLWEWLHTKGPRFALVLGDFGTGKTFLLRWLAAELAAQSDLVPVLVTMRELSKGVSLEKLLAQHMSADDNYHHASFRYLLRQGKVVLLFDGFDELVSRTDYDRVRDHFATLREAADGAAKVVVTSRHQHFATDHDTRTALGGEARSLPGSRTMRLLPLDDKRRRKLVEDELDDVAAADRFLGLLGDVRDLLDLASNPRMLSFMLRWHREGLLSWTEEAARTDEKVTAGRLYERLLATWLEHELGRQVTRGGPRVLSVAQRLDALTELALQLWRSPDRGVWAADLGAFAEQVLDLPALQMHTGEAAHALGSSTVLVRREDDSFGFIHQSVSEWLVARWAAFDIDVRLADRPLTPLMADFLCDLAGDAAAIAWARGTAQAVEASGPSAKANALLVLQRRGATESAAVSYRGQDLRHRDLSGQDLGGADLRGADLAGATLPSGMRGAQLRGAHLARVVAADVDLAGADLSGADLRGAWLLGADLRDCRLDDTRLARAVLTGARGTASWLAAASDTFGAALPAAPVTVQWGPGSPITAIAAGVRTGVVVTGHEDGSLRLCDPDTATWLRAWHGHDGGVNSVAVARDGEWFASGGADGAVRLWQAGTGVLLRTLADHREAVTAVAIAPDGRWLVSGSEDETVRVWDVVTGDPGRTLEGHSGTVSSVGIGADRILTGGEDGTVRVWDAATGTLRRVLGDPRQAASAVTALAASSRGATVVSGDAQGALRLWDSSAGTLLRTLEGHGQGVTAIAVSSWDGRWVSSAEDGSVRVWDREDESPRHVLEGHVGGTVAVADPGGEWLASGDAFGVVRVWDSGSGGLRRSLEGPSDAVLAVTVTPDGSWFASAGEDGRVRVWDAATGAQRRNLLGHDGWVSAVAAGPGARRLLSGDNQGVVREWDVTTGNVRATRGRPGAAVTSLVAAPGALWSASGRKDGTIEVWETATGASWSSMAAHDGPVTAVAATRAGVWLVSGGKDGVVRVWAAATGILRHTLPGHEAAVTAIVVDAHHGWVFTKGLDGTVRQWDPRSWVPRRTVRCGVESTDTLAVAPDGLWLATGGMDGAVRVWDTATGTLRQVLRGHSDWVRSLAVTPDGRWVVSASDDQTVRVWSAATGAAVATLVGSGDDWATLMPDGSYKADGRPAGLWWAAGLCRFEVDELDAVARHQPDLRRLPHDEVVIDG